jgi:hypothetical protein
MSLSENNNNDETKIKIKRTRISKKALALTASAAATAEVESVPIATEALSTTTIEQASLQTHNNIQQIITPLPYKEEEDNEIIDDNVIVPEKVHKKRGRKPKGGKIIVNNIQTEQVFIPVPNVIMHLKCRVADLIQPDFLSSITYNPSINTVETFQFGNEMGYDIIQPSSLSSSGANDIDNDNNNNNDSNILEYSEPSSVDINHNNSIAYNANDILSLTSSSSIKNNNNNNNDERNSTHRNNNNNENEMKTISAKLKELTTNLHLNNISYKKSACFWCTHDFDNPPIFIPKHEINAVYHCYGCFCSPECATAFLFKEHIDTATRFERYHLINHIYCKIYGYTKNVKPAPDPFYLLNKYYGNLSIQEYRQLLKNERLLIIVDKPLSRTLPELHEDNDDFMFNGKTIPSANKFNLKKKKGKTNMKNDILNENFNMK